MNNPSISETYTEDHDRLDDLFYQFQKLKSTDRKEAEKHFSAFKAGLERHIAWEEEILFPSFEKRFGHLGGPTSVMRREHREIETFLKAIAEKLADTDFGTDMEEMGLQTVLCPHNHKEENILYPTIDQVTGAKERADIFARMNQPANVKELSS